MVISCLREKKKEKLPTIQDQPGLLLRRALPQKVPNYNPSKNINDISKSNKQANKKVFTSLSPERKALRYHFIATRMAINQRDRAGLACVRSWACSLEHIYIHIYKTRQTANLWRNGNSHTNASECKMVWVLWKTILAVYREKLNLLLRPCNSTPEFVQGK